MAITTAPCLSWKEDLLNGLHLAGHEYKLALYVAAASMDKNTAVYSATNEVIGTGYTAGGIVLAGRVVGSVGDRRYLSFTDPVWANATITSRGCMIYNNTLAGKNALGVFDFGQDYVSTNGNFTVDLPAVGVTAVLRLN